MKAFDKTYKNIFWGCFIFFYFFSSGNGKTQLLAPDILCVKNDTLFWIPYYDNCGPFLSWNIYFSPNLNGPYNLLAQISDETQSEYFHPNPGNQTWYYYINADVDCAIYFRYNSDTINNLAPEIAPIQSVTVESGGVKIRWKRSLSPEVTAYIIYRNTNIGTIPIDTVYYQLEYLDTNAAAEDHSETYYVVAMDPCFNTSLFDNPHSSMFVSPQVIPCTQTIILDWNTYVNWNFGVHHQEIWLSLNGNQFERWDSLGPEVNQYYFTEVNDNNNYCFFIVAVENSTGNLSGSNTICLDPDIVQPMEILKIKNLSFKSNDQIQIDWIWSENAEIHSAFLHVRNADPPSQNDIPLNISSSLDANMEYIHTGNNFLSAMPSFSISTIDNCDSTRSTSFSSPVFLSGYNLPNNDKFLEWTPIGLNDLSVIQYKLFKVENGSETLLDQFDANTLNYTDPSSGGDINNLQNCYKVVAESHFINPDGTPDVVYSSSNTHCILPLAKIHMPNAFVPRGKNQVFKPVFYNLAASSYEFLIYSRWGQKVFSTNDPEAGWDGKYEGKDVPQGVYTYRIKLVQLGGEILEKTSFVLLIR